MHFDNFKSVKPQDFVFFSDGSKTPLGTGSGVACFHGSDILQGNYSNPVMLQSFTLPISSPIYQAEATGALESTLIAASLITNPSPHQASTPTLTTKQSYTASTKPFTHSTQQFRILGLFSTIRRSPSPSTGSLVTKTYKEM